MQRKELPTKCFTMPISHPLRERPQSSPALRQYQQSPPLGSRPGSRPGSRHSSRPPSRSSVRRANSATPTRIDRSNSIPDVWSPSSFSANVELSERLKSGVVAPENVDIPNIGVEQLNLVGVNYSDPNRFSKFLESGKTETDSLAPEWNRPRSSSVSSGGDRVSIKMPSPHRSPTGRRCVSPTPTHLSSDGLCNGRLSATDYARSRRKQKQTRSKTPPLFATLRTDNSQNVRYTTWLDEAKFEGPRYRSLALFAEQQLSKLESMPAPEVFHTGACFDLLDRIIPLMGSLEPLLQRLRKQILRSVYVEYDDSATVYRQLPFYEEIGRYSADATRLRADRENAMHTIQEKDHHMRVFDMELRTRETRCERRESEVRVVMLEKLSMMDEIDKLRHQIEAHSDDHGLELQLFNEMKDRLDEMTVLLAEEKKKGEAARQELRDIKERLLDAEEVLTKTLHEKAQLEQFRTTAVPREDHERTLATLEHGRRECAHLMEELSRLRQRDDERKSRYGTHPLGLGIVGIDDAEQFLRKFQGQSVRSKRKQQHCLTLASQLHTVMLDIEKDSKDLSDLQEGSTFTALGNKSSVPVYLRYDTDVSNWKLRSDALFHFFADFWPVRNQNPTMKLGDVLHHFIQDRYGHDMELAAQWAYNLHYACQRMPDDHPGKLFFMILSGSVDETVWADMALGVTGLQLVVKKRLKKGKSAVPRDEVIACIGQVFSGKTTELLTELYMAIGPTDPSELSLLFGDPSQPNNRCGVLHVEIIKQYLRKRTRVLKEAEKLLTNLDPDMTGYLAVMQIVSTLTSSPEENGLGMDEEYVRGLVREAFDTELEISDTARVDIEAFIKKLAHGVVRTADGPHAGEMDLKVADACRPKKKKAKKSPSVAECVDDVCKIKVTWTNV
eukprot:Rmarinus@m.7147